MGVSVGLQHGKAANTTASVSAQQDLYLLCDRSYGGPRHERSGDGVRRWVCGAKLYLVGASPEVAHREQQRDVFISVLQEGRQMRPISGGMGWGRWGQRHGSSGTAGAPRQSSRTHLVCNSIP